MFQTESCQHRLEGLSGDTLKKPAECGGCHADPLRHVFLGDFIAIMLPEETQGESHPLFAAPGCDSPKAAADLVPVPGFRQGQDQIQKSHEPPPRSFCGLEGPEKPAQVGKRRQPAFQSGVRSLNPGQGRGALHLGLQESPHHVSLDRRTYASVHGLPESLIQA